MTREEFIKKCERMKHYSEMWGIVWDEIHAADLDKHKAEYWREKCMEWRSLALKQVETTETLPHHLVYDGPEVSLAECRPGPAWMTTPINSTSLVMIVETCLGLIAYGGEGAASFNHDAEDLRVRPVRLAPGAVPVEDVTELRQKVRDIEGDNQFLRSKLEATEVELTSERDKLAATEADETLKGRCEIWRYRAEILQRERDELRDKLAATEAERDKLSEVIRDFAERVSNAAWSKPFGRADGKEAGR